MRRILVDFGRARRSQKRGGARPASLEDTAVVSPNSGPDLTALDEALEKLALIDPRKSQVVELRFFGGLTVEETAAVLSIAPSTVQSDFNLAKLWLLRSANQRHRELDSSRETLSPERAQRGTKIFCASCVSFN
jgi:RNA polymerase sigma factor (TIGR02999 family)